MTLGRDRMGRRVPTLTEVISPPSTVDLLLEVPAASAIEIDMREADTAMLDAADTAIEPFPFNSATIPSVSALLASVEHDGFVSDTAQTPLERVLADGAEVAPFERRHADLTAIAQQKFGKGNGIGGLLNFGDLMVYAIAKDRGEPLLCTGLDFASTDVEIHPASRLDP